MGGDVDVALGGGDKGIMEELTALNLKTLWSWHFAFMIPQFAGVGV